MNTLVSIIVPVYKVEKYLDKCVIKIINQTYTDLQIILVDDGSPDNCPVLCEQWAKKDSRIEVIHKKNGGLSDARNAGLKVAKGEYVIFVDSDDYISINMIEKMLESMISNHADMVICQYVKVFPDGRMERQKPEYGTQIFTMEECLERLLEDKQITNHVWRKMYKKSLLPDDLFPVGKNFEDAYVMADLIMSCQKIVSLDEAYYYYLQNEQGIVKTLTIKNTHDYYEAFEHSYQSILLHYPKIYDHLMSARKRKHKVMRKNYIKSLKLFYCLIHPFIHLARKCKRKIKQYKNANLLCKRIKDISAPRFYILGTPEHGNLGDRAIVAGEENFIRQYFSEYTIVHVPIQELNPFLLRKLKKIITSADRITIHGGGNFGTLYPEIHQTQENAIFALNTFPLVVFPQTFYFSEDKQGQKMLEKTRQVYRSCSNLTIALREKESYKFVKKNFPETKTFLIPDMVLNIPEFFSQNSRNGALICLRSDSEATLPIKEYHNILRVMRQHFKKMEEIDTHVYYDDLTDKEAKNELNKLWLKMASSEIVVTDRLHGMIFAALTKTPCIVFLSKSHKLKGCYEWIKNLNYVKLIESSDCLSNAISEVTSVKTPYYDIKDVQKLYQILADAIK